MKTRVHIFAGRFPDREAAIQYTEEQWAPEPPESASIEAYEAWESDNPRWTLRDDLGVEYLDHDFIETIYGPGRWNYLDGLLGDDRALERVAETAKDANTLVLIFEQAFGGLDAPLGCTPVLTDCGRWPATI